MKASKRSSVIGSFKVMDILEKARGLEAKGRSIIHFEVGEPDFKTPRVISQAGIEAIRSGYTKYTHSLGMPELRVEICRHYRREYGVKITPDQIIVANGSSAGLFLIFAALLDPGDSVIMGTPHYSCYPNYVKFLGARTSFVKQSEKEGFQLLPDNVRKKIRPRTKAILINSPSNPTGSVMKPEFIKEISGLGPVVISDEIYHGLSYKRKARSILEFSRKAFVLSGFSKRYAMTGWRIGWVIAPKEFVRPMQKVQQNFQISPNSIAQMAGITALKSGKAELNAMKREFNNRRKLMIELLREIGFEILFEPEGAFYVFASCRFMSGDSYSLAFRILEEAGVAVTPGIDFGKAGEGYLRFSYATAPKNIREGVRRLDEFIRKNDFKK